MKAATLEPDHDNDLVGPEAHPLDPRPLQVEQAIECRSDAHGDDL
jgi:hypothetical protein